MMNIKNSMKRFNLKNQMKLTPAYIVMLIFVVFVAYLFGWIFLASFSTTRGIFTGDLFKEGLNIENYKHLIANSNGALTIFNTLVYTIPSTILLILICSPAAYILSRFEFKGNRLTQQLFVVALSVPAIMITMPLYYHLSELGVANSRLVIILLFTANSIPFDVYFLTAYFKNVSRSYEEAAAIDGAGPFRTFWFIIFPMAKPAVITLTIFNLIGKWNAYFLPLIFANTSEMRPVGVWLQQSVTAMEATGNYAGMFAAVVLAAAPTMILYFFLTNKLLDGAKQGGYLA